MRYPGELSGVYEEHTGLRADTPSVERAVQAEGRVSEKETTAASPEFEEFTGRFGGKAVIAIVDYEKRELEVEGHQAGHRRRSQVEWQEMLFRRVQDQ